MWFVCYWILCHLFPLGGIGWCGALTCGFAMFPPTIWKPVSPLCHKSIQVSLISCSHHLYKCECSSALLHRCLLYQQTHKAQASLWRLLQHANLQPSLLNQPLQPVPWCKQSRLPQVLSFCRYHIDMWLTGTCIHCSLDVEGYLYLRKMKGVHS